MNTTVSFDVEAASAHGVALDLSSLLNDLFIADDVGFAAIGGGAVLVNNL
jgi:hypothetical protein